jgi:dipicolinate synthase subunit A
VTVWAGLSVAFLGGDAREVEMAALAVAEGAAVRRFGTPEVDVGRPSGGLVDSLAEALSGARVAVGPIPLPGPDGRIFAPSAAEPIYLTAEVLRRMALSAHVVIGKADPGLRQAAADCGVRVHEYEHDTELMLLRTPAIAEGAIAVAIQRSPVTIHGSPIAVIGFGRTARILTRTLLALGARVHVVARRPEARAEAIAMGAQATDLAGIADLFRGMAIVFNTVPARVLSRGALGRLPRGALVVDMSAPPGGVDGEVATELGLDHVWARGLGASAPRTVAASQWAGVSRIVAAALAQD